VGGRLATTLNSTNCIESMISVARTTMGNVKNWKDGSMKKRWEAAGLLEAERNFRRVQGCKEMPTLVAALRRHAAGKPFDVTPANYDQAAA
jgi:putative transposase